MTDMPIWFKKPTPSAQERRRKQFELLRHYGMEQIRHGRCYGKERNDG